MQLGFSRLRRSSSQVNLVKSHDSQFSFRSSLDRPNSLPLSIKMSNFSSSREPSPVEPQNKFESNQSSQDAQDIKPKQIFSNCPKPRNHSLLIDSEKECFDVSGGSSYGMVSPR